MKNQEKIVKKKPSGCGCSNIPISIILIFIGGGYWLFTHQKDFLTNQLFALVQQIPIPEEVQPFLADITANIPTAKPSEKTPESQTATQTQSPPQILANDPQPNAEKQPKTIHKKAVN